MNVLELFPCSGGTAEGLRRAGIAITEAFDYDADACCSYAHNMGHAPIRMDVRESKTREAVRTFTGGTP